MGSFVPGKYFLSTNESITIIAAAKEKLLAEHPELKPFQNEIGSYIARAVESRNERGIARTGGSLSEDEASQAGYRAELSELAQREARKCLRRFRERPEALALLKQLQDGEHTSEGSTIIKDFDIMPIKW